MALSLSFEPVVAADFEDLFALRMEAMRESLLRIGLGDPQRSRERFAGQFDPLWMQHILRDGDRIGFVQLRPAGDHLHLDNLYVRPGLQGAGVGAWALNWAKDVAREHRQDLTLNALKQSDSNRFYQRHGFVAESEQEFDIQYRWRCEAAE